MSHLTNEQRYTISVMLQQGYRQSAIAMAIEKDKSVISREVKRNCDNRNGEYRYTLAVKKCRDRHRLKPKPIKFTKDIQSEIDGMIKLDYSPEQVVGVMKKNNAATVSIERIYQHLWRDKKSGGSLHAHLRNKGRRYRKRGALKDSRGIIKDRIGIEKRPKEVDLRKRFGDLEVDLIIGKNHNQAILTINDRASGMLKMKKVRSKEAGVVTNAIIECLGDWEPFIRTMTADNGKEAPTKT